jgi:SpoIIAA-like
VISRIEGMPPETIGLRASGTLSKDDYRTVLEPALEEGIKSGELRLVFQLTDFHGLKADAWIEDVKTGLGALVRDHSAWRRFALVTDVEWVADAFRLFTWLTPGEVRIFDLAGIEEAKGWVTG